MFVNTRFLQYQVGLIPYIPYMSAFASLCKRQPATYISFIALLLPLWPAAVFSWSGGTSHHYHKVLTHSTCLCLGMTGKMCVCTAPELNFNRKL
jgi:hypothetical protein